jgi:hypothetical protein
MGVALSPIGDSLCLRVPWRMCLLCVFYGCSRVHFCSLGQLYAAARSIASLSLSQGQSIKPGLLSN